MNKEKIFLIIKKSIQSILPDVNEADIKINIKMADLGANSIDRADVVIAVMEELGIKVPLVRLAKAQNIQDLVDILFSEMV